MAFRSRGFEGSVRDLGDMVGYQERGQNEAWLDVGLHVVDRGNEMTTMVPPSGGQSTSIVRRAPQPGVTVDRPSPVPRDFVVTKGVKSLARISGGMPGPVSATEMRQESSPAVSETAIVPFRAWHARC